MSRVFTRRGTWYVDFADERGERVKRALNGVTTKRDAEAELAELVAQVRRRKLGLEAAPITLRSTVWGLVEWWLAERCPVPSRSIERGRLTKHLDGTELATKLCAHVRPEDFEALFAQLERPVAPGEQRRQLAPGSINHLRAKLRTVFERARREGIYHRANPVSETRKRKIPRRDYQTVTASEFQRILSMVAPQWRNFTAATLYLALRKGEAAGMLKSDVDLEAGTIRVGHSYERTTTKGDHVDLLPIPEPMLPYITAALKTPGPWLFPDKKGRMVKREADPHLRLRTALRRCGILRHVRLHDLRHSAATILLRSGASPHVVQRLLRHSDVAVTTKTYAHLIVEDLRSATDALKAGPNPAQPFNPTAAPRKEVASK